MTSERTYRERLWPAWWACLLAALLPGMLAIAYGYALGARAGWLVAGVGIGVLALVLAATAPRISVSGAGLAVGAALLPPAAIGAVEAVDAEDVARLRGPGADARLFTALRPWSCRDAVLVTVADPADPHPAWLVSSRRPARLAAAVAATMGR